MARQEVGGPGWLAVGLKERGQHLDVWIVFLKHDNISLVIRVFRSCAINVITDRIVIKSIILIFIFYLSHFKIFPLFSDLF